MLATDLLLASRALDKFEIAGFPHPRLPPLLFYTETGTNKPMIPTTRTTAPTTRTSRRNLTPRSFARCRLPGSYASTSIGKRTTLAACAAHVMREFGCRTAANRPERFWSRC